MKEKKLKGEVERTLPWGLLGVVHHSTESLTLKLRIDREIRKNKFI